MMPTMKNTARYSACVVLTSLIIAACGGGGSDSTGPANAPAIADLTVTFGAGCRLPSGLPGTTEVVSLSYTDSDGDVRGGIVSDVTTPNVGPPITLTAAIPSGSVTITGTTSGQITVTMCFRFGVVTSFTEAVVVFDAAGHPSNELTFRGTRPGGAPELSRSPGTPDAGAMSKGVADR